eukprot:COSAG01_NODE_163_length_23581_cov_2153.544971_12_plen_178_part_00
MTQATTHSLQSFGFLTVVELPSLGHCGGLLVVSRIGRPIEFHCTAPVATNRAQQIMYGETYSGFLFSDQIGMALIDKARERPSVFITDCSEMLPLTELIDNPLVFAEPVDSKTEFDGSGLKHFDLSGQSVYCVNHRGADATSISQGVQEFASRLPLDEPFERIRQAIEEAHSVLRAA